MRKAVELLMKDFMLTVDMLEPIRRGSAKIIYLSSKGILIYEKVSKAYMMYALDEKTTKNIVNMIPKDAELIVGHKELDFRLLEDRFKLYEKMVCFNVIYTKEKPIDIGNSEVTIKLLSEDYAYKVSEVYSKSITVLDWYVEDRIINYAVYGAFIDGNLCGFIGYHKEGSIGMLEVLPEYRGRGIALRLQAVATNERIKSGAYAYGQVIEENIKSLNLQKKLGYEISEDKVYWLIK